MGLWDWLRGPREPATVESLSTEVVRRLRASKWPFGGAWNDSIWQGHRVSRDFVNAAMNAFILERVVAGISSKDVARKLRERILAAMAPEESEVRRLMDVVHEVLAIDRSKPLQRGGVSFDLSDPETLHLWLEQELLGRSPEVQRAFADLTLSEYFAAAERGVDEQFGRAMQEVR